MESNLSSFAKNTLSVFGARVLLILVSIISSIIVTRILGPLNRGIFELLNLLPLILVSFGNLGIGNANLYFTGKKTYTLDNILSNSLSLSLMLGGVLLIIAYISFFYFRETMFKGIPFHYTHLVFFLIPFLLFQKYVQYTLLGQEDMKTRNTVLILPALITFVGLIFLLFVTQVSLFIVFLLTLASNLLTSLLCFYFISKKAVVRLKFDYKLFLKSVKFGIVPFLTLAIMNLNFRADVFLIKYYLNDTSVGLYSLAVGVVEKIWLLPEAIGLVLFSKISNVTEVGADSLTPVVCRFTLMCSFVIGALLLLTADFLIPFIYGNEFRMSVTPLLILIPGIVAMAMYMVLNGDLTGRGKARFCLYVFSCSLVLNVALNLFVIPSYGINGAALASTISYSVGALSLGLVFVKTSSISFKDLILLRKSDFKNYLVPLAGTIRSKVF